MIQEQRERRLRDALVALLDASYPYVEKAASSGDDLRNRLLIARAHAHDAVFGERA